MDGASLEYLTPFFDLGCITRIKLAGLIPEEYSSILSYLAKPQILGRLATRTTPWARTTTWGQERAQNNRATIRHVAETWPLPGFCEIALQTMGEYVSRAVMEFVKGRSSSRTAIGDGSTAPGWSSAARVPARLKRVELGWEDDPFPKHDFYRSVPSDVEAWPRALLELLEILDDEAQVFWSGKRISKTGIMD